MHGTPRCLPALAVVALAALLLTPGCSRKHFRERADRDVEGVITQKNIFPDWQVKHWHVYPDPRSRFADATNPDRPPYPPDDYAARLLSPNPQRPTKKSGVGRIDGDGYLKLLAAWDAENRAADAGAEAADPDAPVVPAAPLPAPRGAGRGPARGLKDGAPFVATAWRPMPPSTGRTPPGGKVPGWLRDTRGAGLRQAAAAIPEPDMMLAQPDGGDPAAATPGEFGPWVAVRPRIPGPVVADRGSGPTITELRSPVVLVAGEVEQNGKAVPAVALLPLEPGPVAPPERRLPDALPDALAQPQPLPQPKPADPMGPPAPWDPVGKGGDGLPPLGDPAADYLRALESGQVGYRIRLEQAVELGLINGREFQDRREDLYLAALQVTLERFNFAAMGFFAQEAVRRSTGRELAGAGERWEFSSDGSISKLFPTGALLLFRIANQVVVDLSGDSPTTTVGNLALSLSQPFLRGGGRAVTLEGLTVTERNLLYAIRSYARFRKIFFVAIAAGGNYTNNPYGLQGLSPNLGRGIGGNLTAPNVGYLTLLQQQAIINNQRRNVVSLERLLRLYQAFREGGQQSPLQVGQVERDLLSSRAQLLGSGGQGGGSGIRGYLDALDNFKLQLGLPVTVHLELDDAPLKPIRQQLARFDELFAQARVLGVEASKYDRAEPVADFRARWLKLFTGSALTRGTAFAKGIEARWSSWWPAKMTEEQVRARMAKLAEERRKLLDARVERELKKQPDPPEELRRLAELESDIELGLFELRVRAYEAQPWANLKGKERESSQDAAFTAALNAFYLVVLGAQKERLAALYESWPELLPLPVEGINVLESSLDDAYAAAIQAALSNRLDLMNARAQVVDAWRQIAVTANSLQGVFDVRYDLNSSTPAGGNNPVAFSGDRSSHQLTFRAELPLVRRAERNNYRAALVAYQRQRRTLMAFEDNIANDVRADLRQLRTLAELYRIQQRQVEINYAQVDNAEAVLFAPPAPDARSEAGSAAALTQQVLQAQSGLLRAQNDLYTIWVQYLTARMNLYLDLEQMPLDDRGVWCDELFNRTDRQDRPDPRQPGERLHAPRPLPPAGEGP